MKAVKKTMDYRREDDGGDCDDGQATIEGVQTSEKLARVCLRLFDGAHASQKHGGVEKGVDPAEPLEDVISEHADEERCGYEPQTKGSGAS